MSWPKTSEVEGLKGAEGREVLGPVPAEGGNRKVSQLLLGLPGWRMVGSEGFFWAPLKGWVKFVRDMEPIFEGKDILGWLKFFFKIWPDG